MDKPMSKRLPLAIMLPLGLLPATLSILLMMAANALDHAGTRQLFHQVFDTPNPTMSAVVFIVVLFFYLFTWSVFLFARTRLNKVGVAILCIVLGIVATGLSLIVSLIVAILLDLTSLFGDRGFW